MIALGASGGVAMLVALIATPLLIRWLQARGIGQQIRDEGPERHYAKAGTPTMGGIVIVGAAVLGYLAGHIRVASAGHLRITQVFTTSGLLVEFTIIGAGTVGLIDDWLKVRYRRNLGLNKRTKMGGLVIVSVTFAILAHDWVHVHPGISFVRRGDLGVSVPAWLWVVLAALVVMGATNAVNLTDGLDGLAAGSASFAFSALVVIAFYAFRHNTVYRLDHSLDLAVVAAGMVGGCAGFLWWNAAPARIFMGDVGSLAIGAGVAALCIVMNLDLLLPVLGALFVVETLSVIIQVASFRLFHRRVFKMAPLHHHFELGGWPETTVIIRFWVLAGIFTALALGLFYYDFITLGVLD